MSDVTSAVRLDKEILERSGFLREAGEAVLHGDAYFRQVLDFLPAAVYITNASGLITYYNEAAAALWGYRPQLGLSEWCGFWKLYWPDGTPLPHAECPMAMAVREKRPIRGMEALAERPDGIRVPVIPYPTPLYDRSGELIGAVNMVVDITDRKRAEESAHLPNVILDFEAGMHHGPIMSSSDKREKREQILKALAARRLPQCLPGALGL